MASISELLGEDNPDQLKKLLELRDRIPFDAGQASREATEEGYKQLFSKQLAEDAVAQASKPGKSAAASAEVFSSMLPEASTAEAGAAKVASKVAPSVVSKLLPLAAKGLGIAGGVAGLYGELGGSESASGAVPGRPGYHFAGSDIVKDPERKSLVSAPPAFEPPSGPVQSDLLKQVFASDNKEETPKRSIASSESPKKAEYKALLDQYTGKTPVAQKMNVSDAIASLLGKKDDELAAAQQASSANKLTAMLGQAGATIGSALTPLAKFDNKDFWQQANKAADEPVDMYKTRSAQKLENVKGMTLQEQLKNEMAKEDPNSDISTFSRKLAESELGKIGMPVKLGDMSYSNLEKLMPQIARMTDSFAKSKSTEAFREASLGLRRDSLGLRGNSAANSSANKQFQPYTDSLDSVRTMEGLFEKIKSGELKSSNNVLGALESDISKVLTRSRTNAVYDRAHSQISALERTIKNYKSYLSSSPENLLPKEYEQQLQLEIAELEDKVLESYATKSKELVSGANDNAQKEIYKNRFETQAIARGRNPEDFYSRISKKPSKSESSAPKSSKVSSKPGPGSIVKVNGVQYRVGADGDSLEPL